MSDFRKKTNCPSSPELAESVSDRLDGHRGIEIAAHLAVCDFCLAEIEFYRHYPPHPINATPAPPMPEPLYQLAETLLHGETIHIKTLERLLNKD